MSDPFERVIGIPHVLKAHAAFRRVGRGPARAGTERIQVLMDVEIAQGVGRLIHVLDADIAAEHAARLVEGGDDLVRHPLLPVGRIDRDGKHGPGISRVLGPSRKERTTILSRSAPQ